MPQSSFRPSNLFIAFTLFILLATSVQIWQTRHPRMAVAVRENGIASTSELCAAPKYGARIVAENVLATPAMNDQGAPGIVDIQAPIEAPVAPPVANRVAITRPAPLRLTLPAPISPEIDHADEPVEGWTPGSTDNAVSSLLLQPSTSKDESLVIGELALPQRTEGISIALPKRSKPNSPNNLLLPAEVPPAPVPALDMIVVEEPAVEAEVDLEDLLQSQVLPDPPIASLTTDEKSASESLIDTITERRAEVNSPPVNVLKPVAPLNRIVESETGAKQPIKTSKRVSPDIDVSPDKIATGKIKKPAASKSPVPARDAVTGWPKPVALIDSLEKLRDPSALRWRDQVNKAFDELATIQSVDSVRAQTQLNGLAQLAEQATSLAPVAKDHLTKTGLLSARYAILRRLDVWNSMRRALHPTVAADIQRLHEEVDPQVMTRLIGQFRQQLGGGAAATGWANFFLLDDLEGLATSTFDQNTTDSATTAGRVLNRMTDVAVTDQQMAFLQRLPLQQFESELRKWATAPVDYRQLMYLLERYEKFPTTTNSLGVTAIRSQLNWSMNPYQNDVARRIDGHYRNANARVAITQDFMNRMLPVMQDVRTPIRDHILGADVLGNMASWTEVGIQLVSDPDHLRMEMLAAGVVDAHTRSTKGPVTLQNQNVSHFQLRKPIVIGKDGMKIGRSTAVAQGSSRILGLRTDYDRFPIIGGIVRRAAQQQIFEQRQLARRIFERRVEDQARDKIDAQVTRSLSAMNQRMRQSILDPLEKMGLDPEVMAMSTTNQRAIIRSRLAGKNQMGAFTARPQALADSLFSVQLHQSAFNNFIQQMGLDGQSGNLRDVMQKMIDKMPASAGLQIPEGMRDDVEISLAHHDACHVSLDEGRIRVTLNVRKLSTRRRTWKNFSVSANYAANDKDGIQIELARDGVVELVGRRLRATDQFALRGIFGIVFDPNRKFQLINDRIASDPRLAILFVNQFTVRDGWLGLSVGADQGRYARKMQAGGTIRR